MQLIDSEIVPAFFNLLRADDLALQAEATDQLQSAIARLVVAAQEEVWMSQAIYVLTS